MILETLADARKNYLLKHNESPKFIVLAIRERRAIMKMLNLEEEPQEIFEMQIIPAEATMFVLETVTRNVNVVQNVKP